MIHRLTRPIFAVSGQPFRLEIEPSRLPSSLGDMLRQAGCDLWIAEGPGLLVVDGRMLVVLPRCYRSAEHPGPDLVRAVGLTVSCLGRYYRDRQSGAVEQQKVDLALVTAGDHEVVLEQVEAALLLWTDWCRLGELTVARDRISSREPGRVRWPETLHQGHPVPSSTDVVFREVVRSRNRRDPSHELVDLHRRTCSSIGRLLGLGFVDSSEPFSAKSALAVLDRHAFRCFADRQKQILVLLRRFYRQSGGSDTGARNGVHGVFARRFEYVWERMLRVALGDVGRPAGLTGSYRLTGSGRCERGINLLPDILVQTTRSGEATLLVLDAKDYDADGWPGTADLTKQILYRLLLSDLLRPKTGHPLNRIENGFLFPARQAGIVDVRAVHELDVEAVGQAGRIVGLNVDFERVAAAYLGGREDLDLVGRVVEAVGTSWCA